MTTNKPVVAILATGLMGGSLGLALQRAGFAGEIIGWGRSAERLQQAQDAGAIDRFSVELETVVAAADIVVLATPTLLAAQMLPQLLDLAGEHTVITDVASVKGNLETAARLHCGGKLPPGLVLAHPIAGSERSGISAAKADLFRDHRVILTPDSATDPAALALVEAMWQATGAEVVQMSVQRHDQILAATSHLPHVLAFALVDNLAEDNKQTAAGEDIFRFAAGGFRDFTRIASSDPTMWHDIALANREAIVDSIDSFTAHLQQLRTAIDHADSEAIKALFSRARDARQHFLTLLAEQADSVETKETP